MTVESFIFFIIKNNLLIIEGLIAFILFVVLLLAFILFLTEKAEEGGVHVSQLGELEAALKKVLEQSNQIQAVPVYQKQEGNSENSNGNMVSVDVMSEQTNLLMTEINVLKKNLEEKAVELEKIKTEAEKNPTQTSQLSSEEKDKLLGQVKELQNKLSEYEIISEDIADLSLYKEENSKLKKEVDALKTKLVSGAATAAAPVSAATVAAAAAPAPVAASVAPTPATAPTPAPASVLAPSAASAAEFQVATLTEEVAAIPETSVSSPPETSASTDVLNDDLMAEFAAAVESQKTGDLAQKEKQKEKEITPKVIEEVKQEPASFQENKIENQEEESKIEKIEQVDEPDLGDMNMDKMLAEAQDLGLPASHQEDDSLLEAILDSNLDENKLLEEASGMNDFASPKKT